LKGKFSNFRAVVVGDASDFEDLYYQEVKRLAASLNLSDKVVFAGYREDVFNLMSRMDIIAHTSITPEPFGMVIIEAMACGKPVVASSAGGGPLEIVKDGETGFLVDPKDPEKMGDALMALLKAPKLRDKFGRAGRKRVESMFESDLNVREIEKIYNKFLE
jgi:glycosyltransferase involved in cell wall biosynthesis